MLFPDLIPQELKDGAVWCPSGKGGNKSPYRPSGEKGVDYDHPESSFTTFGEAYKLYQQGGYDGVAMLVSDGWFVVDLDHVAQDGKLTVEAQRIIKSLDTYTEQSQGGDGVHIIGEIPRGYNFDRSKYHENHGEKEAYIGPRPKVVAITGNREPLGNENVELRPVEVMDFLKEFMTKPPAPEPTPAADMIPVSDDFIVDHLNRPGTRTGRLWAGDLRDYNDDWSRADLGLINAILKYSDDSNQIERVFRRSGLVRPKDDDKRSGTTYLKATIEYARSTYSGPRYDPNYKSAPMDWDDPIQYDGHPTTEAGGGENVNNQETTKEEEAVLSATGKAEPPKRRYSLRPDDFSDAGNADVFSREYGDVLRFCDAMGWLHWTGKVWKRDDHSALKLAMELSERMLKEAKAVHQTANLNVADAAANMIIDGSLASQEQQARIEKFQDAVSMAEEFLKHARNLRSLTRIKAMLELSIPALAIDVKELDSNPFDLNTPAGIVNLHDGTIRPHDPKAFCTKITAASPSDDGSTMWFDFLDTVTESDPSLEGFLQLVAGAALIGEVRMEAALFFVGAGSNGKSTCTNSWLSVMGDYSGKIDAEILLNTNKNKGPALSTLRSERLVIASELSESRWLDSAALKTLTSTDEIVGEEKFRQPAAFKPSHSLILCTNNLPHVRGRDYGLWRRLICVPFDATIGTENAVENFGEVLVQKCGGYILNWMIQGSVNYGRNNYKLTPYPLRVEEITDRYKSDEDWIQRFITDCIEPAEDDETTPAREVYCVYVDWCKSIGEKPRRERDFAAAMKTAGHESTHKHAGSVYSGIRAVRDLIPEKFGENW